MGTNTDIVANDGTTEIDAIQTFLVPNRGIMFQSDIFAYYDSIVKYQTRGVMNNQAFTNNCGGRDFTFQQKIGYKFVNNDDGRKHYLGNQIIHPDPKIPHKNITAYNDSPFEIRILFGCNDNFI